MVWVNGVEVGRHRGGFTPFTCSLGDLVKGGEDATIVVRARDNYRDPQPRGKQSPYYHNVGCLYTRTTGIWQTVWLEPVPESRLERPRLDWDAGNQTVRLTQPLVGSKPGMVIRAVISDGKGEISRVEKALMPGMAAYLDLPVPANRRAFMAARRWVPV